jgi:SpoVK/Ycf46/Vps4 family AAA+-type ATPase
LGKRVLFKRVSDLQSMWVGECEKQIAEAFEQAKDDEMVLIIDEGDSFLQSRQGDKRSWEISQVNEMLSQMETHTQPFIITSNLMNTLDEACLRRFTFKIKFDFLLPDQADELFTAYFNSPAPKAILSNHILAPGDFANVHKRANVLKMTDSEAIYDMLEQECKLKPQHGGNKIGF